MALGYGLGVGDATRASRFLIIIRSIRRREQRFFNLIGEQGGFILDCEFRVSPVGAQTCPFDFAQGPESLDFARDPELVERACRGAAPVLEGATRSRPYEGGIGVGAGENESALSARQNGPVEPVCDWRNRRSETGATLGCRVGRAMKYPSQSNRSVGQASFSKRNEIGEEPVRARHACGKLPEPRETGINKMTFPVGCDQ